MHINYVDIIPSIFYFEVMSMDLVSAELKESMFTIVVILIVDVLVRKFLFL